jgi:hypothetical protein
MNGYVIGSGAVLTAGPEAMVAGATLHAQTEPALAANVKAALVDFESTRFGDLSRVLVMAAGWNAKRFESHVLSPLMARGECSLVELLEQLAQATGAAEVHVFAEWIPDDLMAAALRRAGVAIVAHPLEAIQQAALISGQRYQRWHGPLSAA